ncbi:YheC/YheD family protein [Paenibacillus sp. strain BS8-2]
MARNRLGIVVSRKSNLKRVLKKYQGNKNIPLEIFAFTPRGINWRTKTVRGIQLKGKKFHVQHIPFPNCIYNRSYKMKKEVTKRIEKAVGKGKLFNIINFFDKWEIFTCFNNSEIRKHVPETKLYSKGKILELLLKHNLLVVKPTYGSRGIDVFRIEQMSDNSIHISTNTLAPIHICWEAEQFEHEMEKILQGKTCIVQQGISSKLINGQYFDIRVFMQKNGLGIWTPSHVGSRISFEQYFNTSCCEGIVAAQEILGSLYSGEQLKLIMRQLQVLSMKAAAAVEAGIGTLGEISIDFMLDGHDQLWIIEVNGMPDKTIYCDADLNQINIKTLEYARFLSTL